MSDVTGIAFQIYHLPKNISYEEKYNIYIRKRPLLKIIIIVLNNIYNELGK